MNYPVNDFEIISKKIKEKIGATGTTYEYLINDYIPSQGSEDMCMFIAFGFNPSTYLLWKIYKIGKMKSTFIEPFKQRVKEVHKLDV
jgi:hypothetical protein